MNECYVGTAIPIYNTQKNTEELNCFPIVTNGVVCGLVVLNREKRGFTYTTTIVEEINNLMEIQLE